MGDNARQGETTSSKKGDNERQEETGPLGRRTHHLLVTKGNKTADNRRQRETRPSGRRTRHPTQAHMPGDNAIADQGRQGLGKADTPSNKGKQEGAQWETKGGKGRQDLREGGHAIQQRET